MILTSVAIAGTLGAGGVKVYLDKKKREREKPWTVVTERMQPANSLRAPLNRLIKLPRTMPRFVVRLREGAQKVIKPFKTLSVSGMSSDTRQEQLKRLSATGEIEVSEMEKRHDRYFVVALSSLALTSAGALFYAPLSWLSLPGLLYLASSIFERTHYYIFEEDCRVGVAIVDWIALIGRLGTFQLFASSVQESLFFFYRRMWIKTEDQSKQNRCNPSTGSGHPINQEQPRFVWLLVNGVEVEVPFDSLKKHDIVVVSAGQMIPVDGTITSGLANIDQRMFTGESQLVEKSEGEEVFASTVIRSGKLYVRVEKAGAETLAAQIEHRLLQTEGFKHKIESRGEAVATKWSWVTLGFTGLALLTLGPVSAAAICSVGFGYQMRAAAPFSVLNYFKISSQSGILVKDGRALELLSKVDTVVFDKTGGLTFQVPHVGQSIRPEAKEIIAQLRQRNLSVYMISDDDETPTRNLAAELGIDHYFAKTRPRHACVARNKVDLIAGLQQEGKSVCFVGDSIALKAANVGISLSGASPIATDSAEIVLMDGTLKQLNHLFELAHELERNLNRSYWLSLLPGFASLGGVFFLNWGIGPAMMLYNGTLVACLGNAMLPLLHHAKVVASPPASDVR